MPLIQQVFEFHDGGIEQVVVCDAKDLAGLAHRLDHSARTLQVDGHRFLKRNVLPCLGSREDHRFMQFLRCEDFHCIDVSVGQHLAEIGICLFRTPFDPPPFRKGAVFVAHRVDARCAIPRITGCVQVRNSPTAHNPNVNHVPPFMGG